MAVLFADVSDSTRLYQTMGDFEARHAVGECLDALRALLPHHRGRFIKTIGDEIMCVFPGADEAVLAAAAMQQTVYARKTASSPITIHVGVHYGPVLADGDDLFGDTVNIAAYLTATANAEEVLTTQAIEENLSATLKSKVRPVFNAVLKGSKTESQVFQVLWRKDNLEITDLNLVASKLIPADSGSLVLTQGAQRQSIDARRYSMVAGRGEECDFVVRDRLASRRHMTIRLSRTNFYLIDHSINGTYVVPEGGQEVQVLHGEMLLERNGRISLGRSCADPQAEIISFVRDRRAIYRS